MSVVGSSGQDLIQRSEVTSRTIPGLIDLQRAIVTPGYPSPSITKLIQPSLPWQNNLQRVVTVPGYSFVSVQRQSELSKAVSDQSLKLDLPAIEIPEVSQRTKQTQTMGWMIPTKSVSGFTSPGFKMEGGGYSESSLRRLLGLRSKKQKYPILSAKEVLTLTAGPSRRRRKR